MKSFVCLKLMFGCAVVAMGALMGALLSTQAQAHGGLSMAEDMCKLTIGPYMMHFTGYQPSSTQEKQFCEDIPGTGHTVVVLDYIEQELRSLPTEVRIIRDTGSEQDLEAVTILHIPPKVYPNGSVDFAYNFDKPGKFVGLVMVGDQQQHTSRFPFSVGESNFISRYILSIYMVPVAALAAVAALFFFMRDRRKSSEIAVS
ncbi:MAG: conserved exported hypothetical protein (AmoD1) [Nitrospira sp.]|nr:MAG: conserved exported hypothetical protein (AmoD1) [Nitrospira sp.]